MTDIVIIGGGVIGLTAAWELLKSGRTVTLLDQSAPGREASWAGAGMIPPAELGNNLAVRELNRLSARLWPELSAELREQTGLDNGYRRCGGYQLPCPGEHSLEDLARLFQESDVETERLSGGDLRGRAPWFSETIKEALWLPTMAQVRNPWHLKTLSVACQQRGLVLRPHERAIELEHCEGRIVAVRTEHHRYEAATFLVAAGAWTAALMRSVGLEMGVRPIRGQIVLLKHAVSPFSQIVECGPRYLVPREDGHLLIGSTEEDVGFIKENTVSGVEGLLSFATSLVPKLADSPVEKTWAGLRPFSARAYPYVGPVPHFPNLFLASGHFRSGLTNSPATAQVIAQWIQGTLPEINIESLSVEK
ncbi:MAG: glycine oxidase ThiO [Planctomycetaceae bacterium]|nr:glycine oxidase ThiO [Planctomycetaceae bacterium]